MLVRDAASQAHWLAALRLNNKAAWRHGGMEDTADLKSAGRNTIRVQVPLPPPLGLLAELADALVLGTSGEIRIGSSPI